MTIKETREEIIISIMVFLKSQSPKIIVSLKNGDNAGIA